MTIPIDPNMADAMLAERRRWLAEMLDEARSDPVIAFIVPRFEAAVADFDAEIARRASLSDDDYHEDDADDYLNRCEADVAGGVCQSRLRLDGSCPTPGQHSSVEEV